MPSLFGNQGDKKEMTSLFGNQGNKKEENKLFVFQDNKKDEHESKLTKGLLFNNVMLNPNNDKENNKKIEEPSLPKLVEKSEESNEKAFDNKKNDYQNKIFKLSKNDDYFKEYSDDFSDSISINRKIKFKS